MPTPLGPLITTTTGGAEGTVGEVLAESLGCDKQDPHAALTGGAFSRAALLEQAVRVAHASLGPR